MKTKTNIMLTAIVLMLLVLCYLSVSTGIKAGQEETRREQAAQEQMDSSFTTIEDDNHAGTTAE